MKRLGKLCLSILCLLVGFVGAYSHASQMTVILRPGWNVFSTPALLSNISFSNGGDGVSFLKLENGQWVSVIANTGELIPLEGFLVENTNNSDVEVTLIYDDNVPPTNTIFQKNLNLGWNFLGITTNVNPFNNIVGNVNMTIDFTYSSDGSSQTNFLNKVNSNYVGNQNSSTILAPQYGEAYGAFITSNNAIYGGINNKGAENGVVDPNAIGCTAEELFACILDDNTSECLDNCRNRGVDLTISNKVTEDVITAPGVNDLVLMDLELTAGTEFDIQKYELKANSDLNFDQFVDGKVILNINGVTYNISTGTTIFTNSFNVSSGETIHIKVLGNIQDENIFTGDYTTASFEFIVKQVKNIVMNKEIPGLTIRQKGHTTGIYGVKLTIQNTKSGSFNYIKEGEESRVLSFNIKATNQDVLIKSIIFAVSDTGMIDEISLYQGHNILESIDVDHIGVNGVINMNNLSITIKHAESQEFYLVVTLNDGNVTSLGKSLTFTLEDIQYKPKITNTQLLASDKGYTTQIEHTYIITYEVPTLNLIKNGHHIIVNVNNDSLYDLVNQDGLNGIELKIKVLGNIVGGEDLFHNAINSNNWSVLDNINGNQIQGATAQYNGNILTISLPVSYFVLNSTSNTIVIRIDDIALISSEDYEIVPQSMKFRYYDDSIVGGQYSDLINVRY